jgi:hypothetical protein
VIGGIDVVPQCSVNVIRLSVRKSRFCELSASVSSASRTPCDRSYSKAQASAPNEYGWSARSHSRYMQGRCDISFSNVSSGFKLEFGPFCMCLSQRMSHYRPQHTLANAPLRSLFLLRFNLCPPFPLCRSDLSSSGSGQSALGSRAVRFSCQY